MSETEAEYHFRDEFWEQQGVTMRRCLRLMDIIQCLEERPHTTNELAERYQVSPRTIRDDLMLIQGHPRYAPLVQFRGWKLVNLRNNS